MAKLKNHYAPTPSRIARRHAFRRREQAEGESVSQFMAGLRKAALHCEFKELDEVLLDGLVCGLRDLRIQRRLLAKPDLTLQSALDEACMELSNRSTIEIKGASSSAAEKKTLAVHQEEATEEDANLPGNDDIYRLKTASGAENSPTLYYLKLLSAASVSSTPSADALIILVATSVLGKGTHLPFENSYLAVKEIND
ncbi:hypothetical protein E2320_018857 [Naja naja]|nr:hypothetical protein E2320_018857 [Naja naja]